MRPWHCFVAAICVHAFVLAIPLRPVLGPSKEQIWVRIVEPSLFQPYQEILSPHSPPSADPSPPKPLPQEPPLQSEALPEIHQEILAPQEPLPPEPSRKETPSKPARKPKPQTAKHRVIPPEAPSAPPRPMEQPPEPTFASQAVENSPAISPELQGARPGPVEAPPSLAKAAPVERSFGTSEGPRFVHKVIPDYPLSARRMRREGAVVLRLHIDEQGRLLEARVVERAGYGLDEAALDAVRRSTFAPATQAGVPVACWATLAVRFVLEGKP